jgi:hypothetical protein
MQLRVAVRTSDLEMIKKITRLCFVQEILLQLVCCQAAFCGRLWETGFKSKTIQRLFRRRNCRTSGN